MITKSEAERILFALQTGLFNTRAAARNADGYPESYDEDASEIEQAILLVESLPTDDGELEEDGI